MNVWGISSNTYNIFATLFKHIFDENEFAPRAYTLIKGAYLIILLYDINILRSRAFHFTVGCSRCHIQNTLHITKTSFKVPKKRVTLVKKSMKNFPNPREFVL